ncbi:MAG TPA: type II CAAX endopeptidase family protein [Candidatus Acidoferrum sp.]|nr:type II CAAX endopeptidase family protein [Candidatus Acidoferrum sp.]
MKRAAQLLRSVMPADFWQLVFLSGVIFLFISPHLPWRTPQSISSSVQEALHPVPENENAHLEWVRLVTAMVWPINFVGLVAYFTCFWTGTRPARRIILAVIIPSICILGLLGYKSVHLPQNSTSSIFATPTTVAGNHLGLLSSILHLPPALCFNILGLVLISVFTVQLLRGKSSLPLSLPDGPMRGNDETESWPQLKILIFVLVAPLYLLMNIISLPLLIPYLFSTHFQTSIYGSMASIVADVLSAALLVIIVLWTLGKAGKVEIHRSLQLPEPRHAFFAALVPVAVCFLIPAAEFLYDRVHWVEHGFGNIDAPIFSSYIDPTRIWDPMLLMLLVGAFAEEIVFRGVLLPRLLERYGLERGMLLTGLIWAAYHFRADAYSGLSVGGVLLRVGHRIVLCLAMNYVFAWMALRWRSIVPAGIAHGVWNILATSGVGGSSPWSSDFALVSWIVAALVLYRYWPLPNDENPEPEPLSASITSTS